MAVVSIRTGRKSFINKLMALAGLKFGNEKIEWLEPYLSHFYATVSPDDLATLSPPAAYEIAMSQWTLARQARRSKSSIRISNPERGIRISPSVVEIITDDMPFLVDTVRMALNREGFTVNLLIHPVFEVRRDRQGRLKQIAPPGDPRHHESFIYAEVSRVLDPSQAKRLERSLHAALLDLRRAVMDWQKMSNRLHEVVKSLEEATLPVPARHIDETCTFLRWLDQKNFVFLGFQEYSVENMEGRRGQLLRPMPGTELGIMRHRQFSEADGDAPLRNSHNKKSTPTEEVLLITKSVARSTIHRPAHLDYIAVRSLDSRGRILGERRFLGLYTSRAYQLHPSQVPLIRQKIGRVMTRSGFDPESHVGRNFQFILETFPRDELFQITEQELLHMSMGILHLGERQKLKLFMREDPLKRFITCQVYVPRDAYDSGLRRKMVDILKDALQGIEISFGVQMTEATFARVEFFIRTDPQHFPVYDIAGIEDALKETSYSWQDGLRDAMLACLPDTDCAPLLQQYQLAFPAAYRERFRPTTAVEDIEVLKTLDGDQPLRVRLYQPEDKDNSWLGLKLYRLGTPIAPSDIMPVLENMGVRVLQQTPYKILPPAGDPRWIHDYILESRYPSPELTDLKQVFEQILLDTWHGRVENDGFNSLGLVAGLASREISLLRAYCKFLLQTASSFSQHYMEQCLIKHAAITRQLMELFKLRFNPFKPAPAEVQEAFEQAIQPQLDNVSSLDEDRILRNFLGIMLATIRCNYYQSNKSGDAKPYLAFKFDCAKVPALPEPRPMFEIFVYSPRVEGVHLRSGMVARGGLRWSDRREDYRTEVLGLVKAQKVKNAVIVPTGAKGGFYVKHKPEGDNRDALMAEAIACYQQFISGLLDLTDNLVGQEVTPPPDLVRYDGDDSYLVVAADKGTATFSDHANAVAADYGFWLGDAFASGGSNGYDHKKMGITARGAWESVKLLFRDLGTDIQNDPISVIGIGDMAGDVFGNGMLLSKCLKLVAAFNHQHIFIDPDPDPASSLKERKRLFQMQRSSWADYDQTLISIGGGVFSRAAKSIPLSSQVQRLLGTNRSALAPNDLISLLLKAPVDLLWNGGIGTYVKASHETHADVGDRANDAVRVNACDLRCKVVGEGGNLGLTQHARIEYALHGGRIDTDFIHNAAGVNCSDHEVNIKILLNGLKTTGKLKESARVELLAAMTDNVSDLVLQSNYWQEQAISLMEAESPALLDLHARYMRHLESHGLLDRNLEDLPNDEQIIERKAAGLGLTRPELAVLLSYTKIIAEEELLHSELWQDPYFETELPRYFPDALRRRFPQDIQAHPLRKELLSTFIVNRMVNRMGCTFLFSMQEETAATAANICRAYTISWEVFDLRKLWSGIAALDNKIPGNVQNSIMLESAKLMTRASKWLIKKRKRALEIQQVIGEYKNGADIIRQRVPAMLMNTEDPLLREQMQQLQEQGINDDLIMLILGMDAWFCAFDIVDIARKSGLPVATVMDSYFHLSAFLDIYWLRTRLQSYKTDSHWQELARKSLIDDFYIVLSKLCAEMLKVTPDISDAEQRTQHWHDLNQQAVDRYLRVPQDLRAAEHQDLAMFSVALRELQNLHQACASTT